LFVDSEDEGIEDFLFVFFEVVPEGGYFFLGVFGDGFEVADHGSIGLWFMVCGLIG
jgi:hypothetical protein